MLTHWLLPPLLFLKIFIYLLPWWNHRIGAPLIMVFFFFIFFILQDPFKTHLETHMAASLLIYFTAVLECFDSLLFFLFFSCPDPLIVIQRWRWRADGGDEQICSEENQWSFPQVKGVINKRGWRWLRQGGNWESVWTFVQLSVRGVRAGCS